MEGFVLVEGDMTTDEDKRDGVCAEWWEGVFEASECDGSGG